MMTKCIKWPTALLICICLCSCELFQKQKLSSKKILEKEILQLDVQRTTLIGQRQLILIDSSHNDFATIIWPKGRFTFSAANGFEGEAEKMMIKSKYESQRVLNLKQATKRDSTLLKANYSNEKASSTTIKKNKLSVGYNWGWVLVFPIFYALYCLYKRYKLTKKALNT